MPRLADFGLARVLKTSSSSNNISGTPAYMAPETFDGKRFEQSDLWSVGVLLYQLLTVRLPFPQTDIVHLIASIVRNSPEPMAINIPFSLRQVVTRALQKDPARRYQSATQMRAELAHAVQLANIAISYSHLKTVSRRLPPTADIARITSSTRLDQHTYRQLDEKPTLVIDRDRIATQINVNATRRGGYFKLSYRRKHCLTVLCTIGHAACQARYYGEQFRR